MTTETMTQADADDWNAGPEHPDALALRAEAESLDPGPLAQDDDTRTFYRYLKLRARAVAELTTLREQTTAMVKDAERRVGTLDYLFGEFAARITAAKLAATPGKSKSLKTPFGTVGYRTKNAALVVVDASAVPDEFKETVSETVVRKARLNEHYERTGEVPAGCDVTDSAEVFYLPK
jgi:hypothetical protein